MTKIDPKYARYQAGLYLQQITSTEAKIKELQTRQETFKREGSPDPELTVEELLAAADNQIKILKEQIANCKVQIDRWLNLS